MWSVYRNRKWIINDEYIYIIYDEHWCQAIISREAKHRLLLGVPISGRLAFRHEVLNEGIPSRKLNIKKGKLEEPRMGDTKSDGLAHHEVAEGGTGRVWPPTQNNQCKSVKIIPVLWQAEIPERQLHSPT